MMSDVKALRVRVSGRVQGVSFRYWTLREAEALGLSGWVRNEPDGTVSALIKGAEPAVDAMLERLREGPSAARVSQVTSQSADPAEAPPDFRITG
ncbi:acylphosphatase [Chelativorans sp. M5D2P16]|uniref:acylphosphatase n=1 Tax=Chelativorans sp. M5D2P16 TaxID=3095678 RepID=UPI002ACADE1B|nr:acylphosphatase [Chelativorans sp. M5D2P16]MDZ5699603.1 acylphosphatase [Chelativorans sp. M5D2P16]